MEAPENSIVGFHFCLCWLVQKDGVFVRFYDEEEKEEEDISLFGHVIMGASMLLNGYAL